MDESQTIDMRHRFVDLWITSAFQWNHIYHMLQRCGTLLKKKGANKNN